MKKTYILAHAEARQRAKQAIDDAPDGYRVVVSESTRTLNQNAKFHAIATDISKSGHLWLGKPRTPAQWKVLLVSGHAVATQEGSEIVAGLEGEWLNIRESTAAMSVKRGASLIEYSLAYAALNGVAIND